jgi:hypothetical protein
MNPKEHAAFTFEDLHSMMSAFVFDIYDQRPHPSLNCSPVPANTSESNEEVFDLMTLPTARKENAEIQPGMGLKILTHSQHRNNRIGLSPPSYSPTSTTFSEFARARPTAKPQGKSKSVVHAALSLMSKKARTSHSRPAITNRTH